jgi:hypothetical protein
VPHVLLRPAGCCPLLGHTQRSLALGLVVWGGGDA